jgi:hypothetical protein
MQSRTPQPLDGTSGACTGPSVALPAVMSQWGIAEFLRGALHPAGMGGPTVTVKATQWDSASSLLFKARHARLLAAMKTSPPSSGTLSDRWEEPEARRLAWLATADWLEAAAEAQPAAA